MKKLNRKGFTLVELLAVIVVIALVLGLSGYGIINAYNKSKNKVIVLNEKSIFEAARIYSTEAKDDEWKDYNDKEYFCTTIQRLKNAGLLKKEAKSEEHEDFSLITVERNISTLNVDNTEFVSDDENLVELCNIRFYTIHYDYNVEGVNGRVPDDQKGEVSTEERPISTIINSYVPVREGYSFKGWNTEADGTGSMYAANGEFVYQYEGIVTLYAQWERNSYTIEYYLGNNEPTEGATKIGELNNCTPSRSCTLNSWNSFNRSAPYSDEGWEFAGWTTSSDSTEVIYNDGDSKNFSNNKDDVIRLYAIFTRKVTFYSGINKSSSKKENQYYNPYCFDSENCRNYYTSVDIPSAKAISGWTGIGYTTVDNIAGSKDDLESIGKDIYSNSIRRNPSYNPELYSMYQRELTLKFNKNGGTGTVPDIKSYQYYNTGNVIADAKFTLPNSSFSRTGYTFGGWNNKADGTGNETYGPNTEYLFKLSVDNSNTTKTFYALWANNDYSIIFDSNSGGNATGNMASMSCRTGTEYTLNQNNYSWYGHTFTGWNTKADGSGTTYADKAKVKNLVSSGSITLFAQWNDNTYTITFANNGATSIGSTSLVCIKGVECDLPSITREGYEIIGWGISASSTEPVSDPYIGDRNIKLYAITKKVFTLTFDANGSGLELENVSGSTGSSSRRVVSCNLYKTATSCNYNTPKINGNTSYNNGFFYSTNKNETRPYAGGTSGLLYAGALGHSNASVNGTTYYVAYKKVTTTFEPNAAKLDGGTSTISKSCNASLGYYNDSGVEIIGKSCSITAPTISRDGYTLIGYNKDSSATTSALSSGGSLTASNGAKYYAITKKVISLTFDANSSGFELENVSGSTGNTSRRVVSCNIYNTDTSCNYNTPKINGNTTYNNGFFYSTNANETRPYASGTSGLLYAGATGSLNPSSSGTTYYVAYNKVTISFYPNGAKLDNGTSTVTKSCNASLGYNGKYTSCSITAPTISRNGYTLIGYNKSAGATTSALSSGGSLTASGNANYYAVTSKEVKLTFNDNGSGLAIEGATNGVATVSCTKYNTDTSCKIKKIPKIANGTTYSTGYYFSSDPNEANAYGVINNNSVSHMYAGYDSDTGVEKSNSITYYVAYGKINVTYNSNGATISGGTSSCVYPLNNNSCALLSPSITRTGYTAVGWSLNSNDTTADWAPNTTKSINSNGNRISNYTYYAITKQKADNNYKVYLYKNGGRWANGGSDPKTFNYVNSASISEFPPVGYGLRRLYGWRVGSSSSSNIVRYTVDSAENGKNLYAYWSIGNCTCNYNKECEVDNGTLTACVNNVCVFTDSAGNNIGYVCQ